MKITKRLKSFIYTLGLSCIGIFVVIAALNNETLLNRNLSFNTFEKSYANIEKALIDQGEKELTLGAGESYLEVWMHYKKMVQIESKLDIDLLAMKKKYKVKRRRMAKASKRKQVYIKAKRVSKFKARFIKKKLVAIEYDLNKVSSKTKAIRMNTLKADAVSEINSDELVSHNGFKIDPLAVAPTLGWANYLESQQVEKTLLANNEVLIPSSELIITDEVDVAQAAPERKVNIQDPTDTSGFINNEEMAFQDALAMLEKKSQDKRQLALNPSKGDELVMIDYSGEGQVLKEEQTPTTLKLHQLKDVSERVNETIAREMNTGPIGPVKSASTSAKVIDLSTQRLGFSANKQISLRTGNGMATPLLGTQPSRPPASPPGLNTQSLLAKPAPRFNPGDRVTHTTLNVLNAQFNQKLGETVHNLTFIPAYDSNHRMGDQSGDGKLVIQEKLNGKRSVLRGTIQKVGTIPTKVDLVLEEGKFIVDLPLIDEDTLANFLDNQKLQGYGSFLLIDLDDQIDSVDVDSDNYEAKLFLNTNFKVVSEVEEYRYIFYVGLPSGNLLLRYLTLKDQVAQKVIHLTEGEVYFEASAFREEAVESFLLFERNIMGKAKSELDLDEVDIFYYNTNIHPKKQALNRYEIRRPALPYGTRRYFEFKHLGESIFLGADSSKKFDIPSRGFIQNAMSRNKLDSLEGTCMIQLNLNKRIMNVTADGETNRGPMNLETTYLDRDGVMNYEASELATNAFLIGDLQGVINIKVEYEDNSVDYLQTYCSPDTYMIEQL